MVKRWALIFAVSLVFGAESRAQQPAVKEIGTISGRIIVLPINEPAVGAEVSFYALKESAGSMTITLTKTVQAEEGGKYLAQLSWGRYEVKARYPGFYTASVWDVYVGNGQKRLLDLSLQVADIGDYAPGTKPPNEIQGTILSSSAEPIPDATVTAHSLDNFNEVFQVRTDSQGKYGLPLPHGGTYILYAQKPGFSIGSPVMAATRTPRKWELVLVPVAK